jgi:hypothetical protein
MRLGSKFSTSTDDPSVFLSQFAPVIAPRKIDRQLIGFRREIIKKNGIQPLAAAQGRVCQPLWEGMAAVAQEVGPTHDAERGNVAFTADQLEHFYNDIFTMLGIAQLQKPAILPESTSTDLNENRAMHFFEPRGACQSVCKDIESQTQNVDFGFLTMKTKDNNMERLAAIPYLRINDTLLQNAMDHDGGRDMLSSLQGLFAGINHDYYHHLTSMTVNPYFLLGLGGIACRSTPFARLLLRNDVPHNKNQSAYGDGMFLHDRFSRLAKRRFESDEPRELWNDFAPHKQAENYEYLALHSHARLYQDYLHNHEFGRQMQHELSEFTQALDKFGMQLRASMSKNHADNVTSYYAVLAYSQLLRIVPPSHNLAQDLERAINDMACMRDNDDLDRQIRMHCCDDISNLNNKNIANRLSGIIMVFRSNESKEEDDNGPVRRSMAQSEKVRWLSCCAAGRDICSLHLPEFETAREKALPAMLEAISAKFRDTRLARYRGGPATAFSNLGAGC